ncbi:Formyltransferase [Xylaria telfairii]|nr:Formyltransferase [Xylaria telfairii]
MSRLLGPLEATAQSAAALFSPRSSQRTSSSVLRSGRDYASRYQRLHVPSPFCRRWCSAAPERTSDPLHILFCGSDEFSCASLKALHDEHVRNPDLIRSIDVVVRPGKRTGRGYKVVRHPPIRSFAERLGLQIHERDTFTGWSMPPKTNLIIAVSFGLFVPRRLLHGAKYGGLNLHPSLLPDLRGPAPLQHTLLSAREFTGVSLQTLDDTAFDHGVVLSQTRPNALRIPPSCKTVPDLQALVTPVAVEMLLDGLRRGLHVPPLEDKGRKPGAATTALVHSSAPKITKADRRLVLAAQTSSLARRHAAIGPLWFWARDRRGGRKRVIVESLEELSADVSAPHIPNILTTNPQSPSSVPSTYKQFLVRLEEEEEEEEEARIEGDGTNTPRPNKYLVFWDDFSIIPKGEKGTLCLGNCRVLSLKVEGHKANTPRLALQNFIIDP